MAPRMLHGGPPAAPLSSCHRGPRPRAWALLLVGLLGACAGGTPVLPDGAWDEGDTRGGRKKDAQFIPQDTALQGEDGSPVPCGGQDCNDRLVCTTDAFSTVSRRAPIRAPSIIPATDGTAMIASTAPWFR